MPYNTITELPDRVKDVLPEHAREIYLAAYNNAWEEYSDPDDRNGKQSREKTAHRVAWSAVKKTYRKDDSGKWIKK